MAGKRKTRNGAPGPAPAGPPDQGQRDRILGELDRNLLVEAAAGTGKTTCMVGRMVALLASGRCTTRELAAVTFTRKAAAEMRARFQVDLERQARTASGGERENLLRARETAEQCFLGTIHSFCGRLLRERPVEAGVDPAFEELDEDADARLREETWQEHVAGMYAARDPALETLDDLGLAPGELRDSFVRFLDFPDVSEWPAEPIPIPDLGREAKALLDYAAHMEKTAPGLPEDPGDERLFDLYRRLPVSIRNHDLSRPAEVIAALRPFCGSDTPSVRKDIYEGDVRKAADLEKRRWEAFAEEVARPALTAWLECRYAPILDLFFKARDTYDRLRRARRALNYQDLLMKAAALLRDHPHVRRYFRGRFARILVDEFQDTDPIQAEVLLLLTSMDPEEKDWRKCRPADGSLFVVGDPKQSIYRFRRADIVTYGEVKRILEEEGEKNPAVRLSANFRSTETVIGWVNGFFAPRFPKKETSESPAYVELEAGLPGLEEGELRGVKAIRIPKEASKRNDTAVAFDARRIARFIRHAIDRGMTVARTPRQVEQGMDRRAGPGDFLILARNTFHLSRYAEALQELKVPHRVTGGTALNETPELGGLRACLEAAVKPDDPVALVAALRGEVFGISDRRLYAFKKAGGRFSVHAEVPAGLDAATAAAFRDAFGRLRNHARWFARLPAAAAVENVIEDLGLSASAAADPQGPVRAGCLAKAVEVLRQGSAGAWAASDVLEGLRRIVDGKEKHDGLSALPEDRPAVRIMNLHKAKGLEAPVVFLADPTGHKEPDPVVCVDRSGPAVRGRLRILGEKPEGHGPAPTVAQAKDWERHAETETRFLVQEDLRLRYVAATRAGSMLGITLREAGEKWNPWEAFRDGLEKAEELPDCPAPKIEPPSAPGPDPSEAEEAFRALEARRAVSRRPTYGAGPAKEIALSGGAPSLQGSVSLAETEGPPPPPPPEGEHGVEWGDVVHVLLARAMKDPKAALEAAAREALEEREMDPGRAADAAASARAVMDSELWRRATRSGAPMAEVPFTIVLDPALDGVGAPTLARGAIDLAFEEDGGWVIADYKTDARPSGGWKALAEKYAPQLRLYALAFERCTGEKVKEMGLHFTRDGTYVRVNA